MQRLSLILSWFFGLALLALSLFVTAETVARKLFNHSFQGADELGGYVLAVGGALSFTVCLIERGHIRIDLLHDKLPPSIQAILNWLATVLLGGFGLFLGYYCWLVVRDTMTYNSIAPTAWATPMIYPQGIWYICLLFFSVTSVALAAIATKRLLTGNLAAINKDFHPKGALEELTEELSDIEQRR
ncbi:MAG: TRAP transporter small permease [Pseudomonadota bacterium]